jgi:pectate lyase
MKTPSTPRIPLSQRCRPALFGALLGITLGLDAHLTAAPSSPPPATPPPGDNATDIVITTQPDNRIAALRTTVSFTVLATGSGPLAYQWRKNGADIPSADSATYTIASVAGQHAGTYSVVVSNAAGSVTSRDAHLTVYSPAVAPAITTQPGNQTVNTGTPATFRVVATGDAPLTYQWQQQLLGTYTNIAGATAATYTVANPQTLGTSNYRVVITGPGGTLTSNVATLTVTARFAVPSPDGYAAGVTGGGSLTPVVVNSAAAFRAEAESGQASVITVGSSLTLTTPVLVKSNKTIQGANSSVLITGNLELGATTTNVIIRGLTLTNPTGTDGISVTGARNVYIAHCTLYDCADGLIDITASADNVTVAWCDFYYSATRPSPRFAMQIGAATGETAPLRVSLHHNLWRDRAEQFLPVSTYGRVHMYNNLLDLTGNTAGTSILANAELLSERNIYSELANPLTKSAGGLIRAFENAFIDTTSTTPVTDTVFTPTYSYRLLPILSTSGLDVESLVLAYAGNKAGLASESLTPLSASISGPSTATAGAGFTLTSSATSFTPASYQWRLNNAPIAGATAANYTATQTTAGTYTVAIQLSTDEIVVSAPHVVTLDAGGGVSTPGGGPYVPREQPSSGGGGGSHSLLFLTALAALTALRSLRRHI